MRASTLLKLRATLRTVSRKGHSQAVSMWALATACSRGASGAGTLSNNGARASWKADHRRSSDMFKSSTTSHAPEMAASALALCTSSCSSLASAIASTMSLAARSALRLTRTSCAREIFIRGGASGIGPRPESVANQSKVGIGLAAAST